MPGASIATATRLAEDSEKEAKKHTGPTGLLFSESSTVGCPACASDGATNRKCLFDFWLARRAKNVPHGRIHFYIVRPASRGMLRHCDSVDVHTVSIDFG